MRIVFLTSLLLSILASPFATASDPAGVAEIAQYSGPDRAQRLLEGAKREGELTFYTAMDEKDNAFIVAAFEKKTGIKVNVWRSGKNKVLQRVITEARAGHSVVDFVQAPSPEMEALHREKLLQAVRSPAQKQIIPAALPAHGEWTGMRVNVYVQAYNTQKVSRDELPRSYEQLLNPRWKGKLGVEAKGQEWFYAVVQSMGEEKGLRFFRDLASTNGLSVRSGNSLLANMVVSGEVPFALTVYSYSVEQNHANGAPIDFIVLPPTVAHTDGIGVTRGAPHPYAATLFYDFLLSDGQKLVSDHHGLTTNRRDEATLARFNPTFIDPSRILDTYEKWSKLYDDVLQGR